MATTKMSGIAMVGFPYDRDMTGMVCSIAMIKK